MPTDAQDNQRQIIVSLLEALGEDPNRDGLLDTPARVIKAWKELTVGYSQDPKLILDKRFEVEYDEIIILRDIEFYSTCEHHMLPYTGRAYIGYIPSNKVVGISKLARLVECFARRLQIQERMTMQIATAINEILEPKGVGVVVKAQHFCMKSRGVKKENAEMVTSCMLGVMREKAETRHEFLTLAGLNNG